MEDVDALSARGSADQLSQLMRMLDAQTYDMRVGTPPSILEDDSEQ